MEIILKKWTIDDKAELANMCNKIDRKFLSNRIPFPYTQKDATWWLNMALKHEEVKGVFRAIVVDGEYVGNISVEKRNDVYCKDAEMGYFLLDNQCSKGIMTQCVKEICSIAFSSLDILRISALVYKPNIASQRVLEKNNFTLEGIMKNAIFKNDNIYDLCIYGKYR